MSYSITLQNSSGKLDYANVAAIASTTTPYVAVKIRGDALNALTALSGVQQTVLWAIGGTDIVSDYSLFKMALVYNSGGPYLAILGSDGTETFLVTHFGTNLGSFNAGTYYELRFSLDAANNPSNVPCYLEARDESGSVVAQWWHPTSTPTIGTTAGGGCLHLGNNAGGICWIGSGAMVTQDWTIDSAKMGTSSAYSDFNSALDEGTGTSVSPSGTVSGSYTWNNLVLADHGVVTLTPSSIAYDGSGTATVDWQDASNVSLVPQPTTTWSVVGNGATIDASGNYTGQGAGTATIRATTGSVHADAVLTLTRRLTITGSMTVS